MTKIKEKHRQPGTIDYVERPYEDIPWGYSVSVRITYDKGRTQSFICDGSKEKCEKFLEEIRKTFNVKKNSQLIGKRCFALRNFTNDDYIKGIESKDTGKKFIYVAFLRKINPGSKEIQNIDIFSDEKEDLLRDIASHKDAIKSLKQQLKNLKNDFVDWEKKNKCS